MIAVRSCAITSALAAVLFLGLAVQVMAHGDQHATDDHSVATITEANAQAHIDLAVIAKTDAETYVATLQETDEDAWRGSVPFLADLARDLAGAQAAYDSGSYADAADRAQSVIDLAKQIIADNPTGIDSVPETDGAETNTQDVETLRAQVVVLMQRLIELLQAKLVTLR